MALPVRIMDYGRPDERDSLPRGWVIAFTGVMLLMGVALLWLSRPPLSRASEQANRHKCASNLRQIAGALLIYANDFGGAYPLEIDALMRWDTIRHLPDHAVWCCPSSNGEASRARNVDDLLKDLADPKHMSYRYYGGGLTTASPKEAVLAIEYLSNHDGDGGNILFADGHVDFYQKADYRKLLAELESGHNPPRPGYAPRPW